VRILHMADVHLGYQQYNSRERFNDFGRAFLHAVGQAKERRVGAVLLAGDLFEKRIVDPLAMRQAVEGLQELQAAHIPVIAVEGNHERAHYRDQYSWLEFLDAIGLITLLNPTLHDGQMRLDPYTPESGGAYVDLPGGIRVYGLKYYGASTDRVLGLLAESLAAQDGPRPAYSILLMHAGLEGILPRCSGVASRKAVEALRPWIQYLALGHIHKPFELDGWIYNPGSLETWAMDEAEWTDRGFYLVEVAAHSPMAHRARLITTPRRRFTRLRVSVTGCPSPQAVYDAVRAKAAAAAEAGHGAKGDDAPVVELTLEGSLAFDRLDLDLGYVETMVKEALQPLLARVRNLASPPDFEVGPSAAGSRAELEHQVLSELIERDERFRRAADQWAEVALGLKRMALEGRPPDAIVDYLRERRSALAAQDG